MTSQATETDLAPKQVELRPEEYTVGWICALSIELTAVLALLDRVHKSLESQPSCDENHYHLGSIGKHNLVITCLSSIGLVNAATAAKSMQATFSGLRFGLMVGIGAGIPSLENDIRLGDIVVSSPTGQHGGVLQYDSGKLKVDGFHRTGLLNRPPKLLLGVLPTMQATRSLSRNIFESIRTIFVADGNLGEDWSYPKAINDNLFKADVHHVCDASPCAACISSGTGIVDRTPRLREWPKIHYGNIASGNLVVETPEMRDRLGKEENVICIDTEAAGLMNDFPCLVIRGINTYADSHKNDKWNRYAAAVAAIYTKKLLQLILPAAVQKIEPIQPTNWMIPLGRNNEFIGHESKPQNLINGLNSNHVGNYQQTSTSGLNDTGKTRLV